MSCRSTALRLLPVLLVLLLLQGPSRAEEGVEAALQGVRGRTVRRLEGLLDWAKGKRINGFRHRVYARILEFEPDHRRARKVLEFTRASKDDPWKRSKRYRAPADFDVGMVAKAEDRLQEVLAGYRDGLLAALDEHPDASPTLRAQLLERLVDAMPGDAELRRGLGHVEHEGRWVLPETVVGESTRAAFGARVAEARKRVARAIRRDAEARKVGWSMAYRTETIRVFGSLSPQIGRQTLLNMEVGAAALEPLFGKRSKGPYIGTAILLENRDQARELFRRLEDEEALADIDHVGAMFLDTGEYVVYRRDASRAPLGALRQVIDGEVDRAFRGHERGWLTEGVGQRLTWLVAGERGPHFVNLRGTERLRDETGTTASLPDDAAVWPGAAAALLARGGGQRLVAVLTMRLNAMKPADVLVAYGLAAYLLEARPDRFLAFAAASAENHDAAQVLEQELGADPETVAWRIRRWLLELR